MDLGNSIDQLAQKIRSREEERKAAVKQLAGRKKEFCRKVEEKLAQDVAAVDGGLLISKLHGMDLIVARAVAVHYQNKDRLKVDYYPSKNPSPHLFHTSTDDEVDAHLFASIKRQSMEIETLLACIKKCKPNLAIMDGSIAPYPRKPEKGLQSRDLYDEMIKSLVKLFEESVSNNTIIAGVSKDSGSSSFAKKYGFDFFDTVLLFDLLDLGERTLAYPLTEHPDTHAVYKDLGEWASRVYFFYMRCAAYDRPIRVDFLSVSGKSAEEEADKVAGMILSQSKFSRNYGYPTILIEADQRARLKESDTEVIYNLISHKVGLNPTILKLRRNSRPY